MKFFVAMVLASSLRVVDLWQAHLLDPAHLHLPLRLSSTIHNFTRPCTRRRAREMADSIIASGPSGGNGGSAGGVGLSGAAQHAQSLLYTSTLALLSSTGFRHSSAHAADVLTEVLQRYIELVGRSAVGAAGMASREQAVPRDVALALEELGTDMQEITEWLEVEGSEEKELARAARLQPSAEALRALRRETIPEPSDRQGRRILSYERLSDTLRDELKHAMEERQSSAEAGDEVEELDDLFSDAGPSTPSSSATSQSMDVDDQQSPAGAARSRFSYIPAHFPPIPKLEQSSAPDATAESRIKLKVEENAGSTKRKAEAARAAEQDASDDASQEPLAHDPWKETIPFARSQLKQTSAADDLPSIDTSAPPPAAPRASSLHAFAADFVALQQERTSSASAGLYLTPDTAQKAEVRTKRRRIAAMLADPARFAPMDSLHACVAVRPSASPFAPSPSLLITLPSDGSAPMFTPTNPHGRTVSLVPPSGALHPALGYRWPSHVYSAVRATAELDVQRKVSRMDDPPPLYDAQHVERVFRGAPASRQLLGLAHSALAPALNALAIQQKRKLGLENSSSDADLELPSKGTLVYTWDWTTRDPYDATLSGNKRMVAEQQEEGKGTAEADAIAGAKEGGAASTDAAGTAATSTSASEQGTQAAGEIRSTAANSFY